MSPSAVIPSGDGRFRRRPGRRLLAGTLALAATATLACTPTGGLNDMCRRDEGTGTLSCDEGLLCDLPMTVCVKPLSRRISQPCGSNAVCVATLFCACPMGMAGCDLMVTGGTCQRLLTENQVCPSDAQCASGLVCHPDLANAAAPSVCTPQDSIRDLLAFFDSTPVRFGNVTASATADAVSQQLLVDGTVNDAEMVPAMRHLTINLTMPADATTADVDCVASATSAMQITYQTSADTFRPATGDSCTGSFHVVTTSSGQRRLQGTFVGTLTPQTVGAATLSVSNGHVDVPIQ